MDERLDQFVDQFANRMNDMMNLRRCKDHNGRRSEDEELGNPFFEGDCSSSNEWGDYGVTGDGYEGPPAFDDGQYEEEIVSEDVGKGFVDNYPNFQNDENNVSFLGVVLGVEEESMPVYDTDIEDVIGEEEESMKDVVVVANDLCSSMIQTTLKGYLKAIPMDDKLGFKTIKVRGRVIIKKREFDAGDTNLDAKSTRDE
ncbi:hypothetical protein Tco_0004968 [Tanacetum coccineum]